MQQSRMPASASEVTAKIITCSVAILQFVQCRTVSTANCNSQLLLQADKTGGSSSDQQTVLILLVCHCFASNIIHSVCYTVPLTVWVCHHEGCLRSIVEPPSVKLANRDGKPTSFLP